MINNMEDCNSSMILDCPCYSESDQKLLSFFSFWVEGVLTTIVAFLGILGNTVVSFIISNREMRNSFNLLLVSLACFDSTYLFASILESFRDDFQLATQAHIVLFPYFLYPVSQVAITGSIFMTVAIAWERYVAVHYPLDYNQAMNDVNAIRKRLLKYVGPCLILAFLFNILKFFEANVRYERTNGSNLTEEIEYVVKLEVAALRTDPVYSAYNNWSRLIVLGIIPFTFLVFFNTKIYKDINERRKRRLRTCRPSVSNVLSDFGSLPPPINSTLVRRGMSDKRSPDNEEAFDMTEPSFNGDASMMGIVPDQENNKDAMSTSPRPSICGSRKSCLKVSKSPDIRAVSFDATAAVKERVSVVAQADQSLSLSAVDTTESAAATAVLTMAAAAANTTSSSRLQLRHVQNCNERRRIFEDNLAAVCMGFVLAFLVCHFPRLLLNMHELITMKVAMKCLNIGLHPFSVWSMVTISVSHFLLVVNSATNILVYCLLSSRFREECAKIIKENYNCFLRRRSAAADHNEDHENDDIQPQV